MQYHYYFCRLYGHTGSLHITKLDIFHKWLGIGWARLSNKSYKIECFYFWQYVLWPPPSPTFVKKSVLFIFLKWGWPPPSYLDNVFKYTVFFRLPLSFLNFYLENKVWMIGKCRFKLSERLPNQNLLQTTEITILTLDLCSEFQKVASWIC